MSHRLAAAACLLALAACSDGTDTTAPLAPDDASLAAITVTENEVIPLAFSVLVPCANDGAGEIVAMEGYLHILSHVTQNDNGFHVKQLANPQHMSGTGAATGDRYQGTGATREMFNVGPGETFTYVNNYRIIGQGPGNNFIIHQVVHTTINANGDLTTEVDNLSVDCR